MLREKVGDRLGRLVHRAGVPLCIIRERGGEPVSSLPPEDHDDRVGEELRLRRLLPQAAEQDYDVAGEDGIIPKPDLKRPISTLFWAFRLTWNLSLLALARLLRIKIKILKKH